MKKSHTLQPGAQKPQPGPLPTGPWTKKIIINSYISCSLWEMLSMDTKRNSSNTWRPNIISPIHEQLTDQINRVFTYSVEPVVDEMLQIFAHPDLSHQLVLVAVHACQLTHMSEDVLQTIRQLKYRGENSGLVKCELTVILKQISTMLRHHWNKYTWSHFLKNSNNLDVLWLYFLSQWAW